jgi:arsenite-transporting ATPase
LVLVTRPEPSAIGEAERTSVELQKLGVGNQHLVINGVFTAESQCDAIAAAMQQRCVDALEGMPAALRSIDRTIVPLTAEGLMGVDSLRQVGQSRAALPGEAVQPPPTGAFPDGLGSLVDELAATGHGVILAMGKGGVGKTTVAASVAVALADRGFDVHLSTTDPAAHLNATLAADEIAGLTVSRIDPARETAEYTAEVLRTAGGDLDADGKALLEEDLRSPCTEEIAVFRAFAKAVSQGANRFVVLDTAPTGHTILLLDSALAYHREVTRQASQMPEAVRSLLPRLRDPEFTRVLVVTLPEATPVHEAARLQADLRRAEIEPFAWIINQSLVPLDVNDPILRRRQHHELEFIDEVRGSLATRVALVPWQTLPPAGTAGLRRLIQPGSSLPH